jgi:hypothetical protein
VLDKNMAIVDEIRRLQNLRPFDPFTVVTSGGNRYDVASPVHASTNPQGSRVVVYFDDGTLVTMPALHIASVEHREPAV